MMVSARVLCWWAPLIQREVAEGEKGKWLVGEFQWKHWKGNGEMAAHNLAIQHLPDCRLNSGSGGREVGWGDVEVSFLVHGRGTRANYQTDEGLSRFGVNQSVYIPSFHFPLFS